MLRHAAPLPLVLLAAASAASAQQNLLPTNPGFERGDAVYHDTPDNQPAAACAGWSFVLFNDASSYVGVADDQPASEGDKFAYLSSNLVLYTDSNHRARVRAGESYTLLLDGRNGGGATAGFGASIRFFDAGGADLGSGGAEGAFLKGTRGEDGTAFQRDLSVTGTAPAGAVAAGVQLFVGENAQAVVDRVRLLPAGEAAPGHSRIRDDWFPVHIPTLGSAETAGSPIDLSFLSPEPAGASGRLRARADGELVDDDGRVVKLFGTNISDWHTMPPAELARPVAVRLRELGVNFIRLHMSDFEPPRGIMDAAGVDVRPEKLDELHRLVAELAEAGIYSDVNLHVARHYAGFPEGWSSWMGKGVDKVLPRLIEEQKRYARQVLSAPNPHRGGRSLAEDPAVAIVEINNENSLLRDGLWLELRTLPAADRDWLQERWNAWLDAKHGGTAGLREAWDGDLAEAGRELLGDGVESLQRADSGDAAADAEVDGRRDDRSLRWSVREEGDAAWSHQLHSGEVDAADGQQVVLRLRHRGDAPMGVRIMQAAAPWADGSLVAELPASEQWREAVFGWTVRNASPGVPLRLTFDAGNRTGVREIADLSLREGGLPGLGEGERVEDGTVPIPGVGGSTRAMADWRSFCTGLELAYTREMSTFLRGDLGVQAMILDTQAGWGGGPGLVREVRNSDLIDGHSYPAHPQEGGEIGGERSWRVAHRSLVGSPRSDEFFIPRWQVKDTPYALTEFDLNPPQDHNPESYPVFSLYASYQGQDVLGEYAWLNYGETYDPQSVPSPYPTAGNPAQIAFMPTSAMLFRLGLVEPAGHPLTLSVHEETLLAADLSLTALRPIWDAAGVPADAGFRQRTQLEVLPGAGPTTLDGTPLTDDRDAVTVSDSGQLTLDHTGPGVLTVDAPQLKMAMGHTGGRRFDLGGVAIEVTRAGGLAGDLAYVTLVSLDGEPIENAQRLLLTQVARVHGEGWRFHDDEDTLSTLGEGPMRAEPVAVRLGLPGGGWRMTPLDGTGRPAGAAVTELDTAGLGSLWFLLERAAEPG